MKIIVTGCRGQLGTEILKQLREAGDDGFRQQLGRVKRALHVRIQAHEVREPALFQMQLADRRQLLQQLLETKQLLVRLPVAGRVLHRSLCPR